MSNIRISQLPSADTPLSGAEIMPLVQDGVTVKATVNQIGEVFTANTLQSVTDNGNVVDDGSGDTTTLYGGAIELADNTNDNITNIGTGSLSIYKVSEGGAGASLSNDPTLKGTIVINNGSNYGTVAATNITNNNIYQLPNASGTIALLDDIDAASTLQNVTAGTNKNLTDGVNLQGTGAGDNNINSRTDINALGTDAGKNNDGNYLNALGNQAAKDNTADDVNALGASAGKNNTGQHLNAFGSASAQDNSGLNVNAFGASSANGNSGDDANAMGNGSAQDNSGYDLNAFGSAAAQNNSGNSLNAFGASAGANNTANEVNAFGSNAAYGNSGLNVNALGTSAGVSNTFSHVTLLGKNAQANAAKQLVLADGTLNARISYLGLTASRTYELPDVGGTFTLTNGIGVSGFITRWFSATSVGASTLLSDNSNTISIGNSSPSASARLQVDSTTSGFLPPRMTTTQRNAISSPAEGLCVYDTTLHKLYVYDGTIWNACW
jgi:hypothetical protein